MTRRATGSFDVDMRGEPPFDTEGGVTLGRTFIDKRFAGDLEGTSRVEMIAAMTPVPGSAGYVAIERVRGSVHGRSGSFVLLHTGLMNRGMPTLQVVVVPDSGTGALASLSGSMVIDMVEGKHFYTFDYDF